MILHYQSSKGHIYFMPMGNGMMRADRFETEPTEKDILSRFPNTDGGVREATKEEVERFIHPDDL